MCVQFGAASLLWLPMRCPQLSMCPTKRVPSSLRYNVTLGPISMLLIPVADEAFPASDHSAAMRTDGDWSDGWTVDPSTALHLGALQLGG
jgi:hypothetical protein